MVRTTVLASAVAAVFSRTAQASYALDTIYDASNFFHEFNHFTEPDPTQGFVKYADQPTAQAHGLSGIRNGSIYMGVDAVTPNPPNGRLSVRLESQKTFTTGLFVADIAHMPSNTCGVWPAFWTYGPSWPQSGEIDILEGVNTQTKSSITLHTGNSCKMSGYGAKPNTLVVEQQCNSKNGCGQQTGDNQNYGDGFNAIGGGVYAMEWTDWRISVWFFPRSKIPKDITSGSPEPLLWGQPEASFSAGLSCDIQSTFQNHKIVFDTTFCGQWAGDDWSSKHSECSAHGPSCQAYVAANPQAFKDVFWSINSLKVYHAKFL